MTTPRMRVRHPDVGRLISPSSRMFHSHQSGIQRALVVLFVLTWTGSSFAQQDRAPETVGPEQASLLRSEPQTDYVAKQWTTTDGLPHDWIWALEEARNGGLWVGTLQGLAHFDGHSFKTFPTGKTGSRVQSLLQDSRGTLWIGTATGLVVRREGTFQKLQGPSRVEDFDESGSGTVWIAGRRGLYRSRSGETVEPVYLPQEVQGEIVHAVEAAGADSVWVAAGNHLLLHHDGSFRTSTAPQVEGRIQQLASSEDGPLWLATGSDVASFQEKELTRYSHPGGEVRSLHAGPAGTVWLTTLNAGLLRVFDSSIERVHTPKGVPTRLAGLARDDTDQWWVGTSGEGLFRVRSRLFGAIGTRWANGVNTVYASDQGSVWAGVYHGGLYQLDDTTQSHWTTDDGLPHSNVVTVAEDASGTLWVGTQTGVARLRENRFVERTRPEGGSFGPVRALYLDPTGTLWITDDHHGLYRYHEGTLERMSISDRLSSVKIPALHLSRDGSLWIGTQSRGVARMVGDSLTTVGDSLTWYDSDDGVPHATVRDIHETGDGRIWISTYGGGIARFDENQFTPITPSDGLPDGTIHAIHEAPEGAFWMTSNGGVFRVPRRQLEAVADGKRDRIYPQTFGVEEGMPIRECNGNQQPVIAEDNRGRLWIPTTQGLTFVQVDSPALGVPDSIPVTVTAIRANGTDRSLDSMRFAPDTRRLTFDFTALSLRYGKNLSFRYRLDDGPWMPAHSRRTAEYTNVEAGMHKFEVQATINGERWYSAEAPLQFVISPHFYETWWFQVIVGLGLLGIIGYAYRWRVRRLRRRQKEMEAAVEDRTRELVAEKKKTERQAERLAELDEAKNRFFAHVSHEFRTPLSLILGPLRDALQRATDGSITFGTREVRRMTDNAERLQRLIDQLLELATLEAGQMDLQRRPTDLAVLTERTAESFRSKAKQKDLKLQVHVPEEGLEGGVDPKKVETIVSNLVGNAVKYTPAGGTVTVRARETDAPEKINVDDPRQVDGVVRIEVSDTGPGIAQDAQSHIFDRFQRMSRSEQQEHDGMGLGLALTSELVELHGGTVEVESTPGKGATFKVWLPVVRVADTTPWGEIRGDGLVREGTARASVEKRDTAPVVEGSEDSVEEPGGEDATVLVVEDNDEMRAYLREVLCERWAVLEAENGKEGWALVQREEPDLVLSDVMMPGIDGAELCERIKSTDGLRVTPVLLLTAQTSKEATIAGLETGANDFVTKPFDPEELRQRIENHLAARRHARASYREEARFQPVDQGVADDYVPFLEDVTEVIEANLFDPDFTVGRLADEVALSRRQLTRRLKKAVGESPAAFVRDCRIERAKALLEDESRTVAEVAYAVGFRSPSHFSQVFQEKVGPSPSDYQAA